MISFHLQLPKFQEKGAIFKVKFVVQVGAE